MQVSGRWTHNNSLQLTRLACGKLERDLPIKMRENGWAIVRAAGQLSSEPLGSQSAVEVLTRTGLTWFRSKSCLAWRSRFSRVR